MAALQGSAHCLPNGVKDALTMVSGMVTLVGIGRGSRVRTRDLRFWRPPLYQLSYTPIPVARKRTANRAASYLQSEQRSSDINPCRVLLQEPLSGGRMNRIPFHELNKPRSALASADARIGSICSTSSMGKSHQRSSSSISIVSPSKRWRTGFAGLPATTV